LIHKKDNTTLLAENTSAVQRPQTVKALKYFNIPCGKSWTNKIFFKKSNWILQC